MSAWLESLPRPTKTYHHKAYDRILKNHAFTGTGKTILVTGGASGIGYSISQAFANAGASRIAIVSRSAGPQAQAKRDLEALFPNTQILTFQASITDNARMTEILHDLGAVDVVILNAAVAHRRIPASEVTTEEVQEAFNTNTIPVFNITKTYLAMPPPPSGRKTVINISAGAAHHPGHFRVGYGPSKAAAAQIMQNFASQYRGGDVRVLSFHPGSLWTPGVAAHFKQDVMEWDDVELPAHFAVWLAGEESGFLHGRHLWANWDVEELVQGKERFEKDMSYCTIGLVQ